MLPIGEAIERLKSIRILPVPLNLSEAEALTPTLRSRQIQLTIKITGFIPNRYMPSSFYPIPHNHPALLNNPNNPNNPSNPSNPSMNYHQSQSQSQSGPVGVNPQPRGGYHGGGAGLNRYLAQEVVTHLTIQEAVQRVSLSLSLCVCVIAHECMLTL